MAIRALAERNAGVTRFVIGTGRVALLARDLNMQAGQWIARFRVIKLLRADRFPVGRVVTLGAVVT